MSVRSLSRRPLLALLAALGAIAAKATAGGASCDDESAAARGGQGTCREQRPLMAGAAASEHLLLQRKLSRSVSSSSSSTEGSLAPADCHTAVLGEPCFAAVKWARDFGVVRHPDWYPGLNHSSSLEEFQRLLHEGGHGAAHDGPREFAGCRRPCETPQPALGDGGGSGNARAPACHTAVPGERCYIDVKWAMDFGIKLHPDWYPTLNESSSFRDVQMALHRQGGARACRPPCGPTSRRPSTPAPCHTPVQGERCYLAVRWAKAFGVKLHPKWYPGLTPESSLREFQGLLHKSGLEGCGKPCAPGAAPPAPSAAPSPAPAPRPPGPPPSVNSPTRFMSWNVYYLHLQNAGRVHGVAEGIARVGPEIASIQEMWSEKPAILARLIEITGKSWMFAPGGETETVWDGDILYRSDLWRHRASGVRKYQDRGLSWAALERIADGAGVLVYGTHPWYTYPNDRPILETMKMATNDMKARQKKYPYPVVFMGDMNAHYELDSQRLLRSGSIAAYGTHWCAPLTFVDSYAETHPDAPNPPSGNWPVKIDFVYFEKSPNKMGKVADAKVWAGLPGGSDHFAVSGDIILNPVPKGSVQNAKFLC